MLLEDFEKYLRYERQISEGSIRNYVSRIKEFKEYLARDLFNKKDFRELALDEIREFLIYIKETNKARPCVVPNFILAFRSFFNWLAYITKKQNIIEISFFLSKIVKVKRTRPIQVLPTSEEINKLRKTLRAYKIAMSFAKYSKEYRKVVKEIAMLELLITTGLRSGELRQLRCCDIDLSNNTIFIRQGKGNQQRISLFNGAALGALKDFFEIYKFNDEDVIFPIKQGNIVNLIIKRWAKKSGINEKLHAHSFRHFFITESQKQGVPAPIVARQVGHRDLNSTLYYTHLDIDSIKKQYRNFKI